MKMRKYKNHIITGGMAFILFLSAAVMAGCSASSKNPDGKQQGNSANPTEQSDGENSVAAVKEFSIDTQMNEDYTNEAYDEKEAEYISLSQTVTITSSGTYILSGKIEDGQVLVNSQDEGKVRLILDNVDITNSSGPAIYVEDGKTILTLAEGSVNTVTDGTEYGADTDGTACIYSKKDLCINGSGTLTVKGNYKAGIQSKKDLRIINGNMNVTAAGDGIKGKDSVVVTGGKLEIQAEKEGIQATNTEEETGYIAILGGNLTVFAGSDGIKGETIVEIDGGTVRVTGSDEGIEALYVRINGGDINICATDDGINASDGSGQSGDFGRGTPGMDGETASSGMVPVIYINGGNTYIDAGGDGIDSNGNISVTGGTLTIDGPTDNGNGFFDYQYGFAFTGGTLIGSGSAGMLELPDESSTQNMIVVGGMKGEAGNKVEIREENGNAVLSFTPAKTYQAVAFGSGELKTGTTYAAYCGDSEIGSVTVSQGINYIGIDGNRGGNMPGGRRGKEGERPERMSGGAPEDMPERMSGGIPEDMPERMPEGDAPEDI